MSVLTVEARSLIRAREIEAALEAFDRDLLADDGHYVVNVSVPGGDRGLVAVLNALERYARERGDGATRLKLELDGETYLLETVTERPA